uniref:Deoxyuridine 5'-triphosphate nucleotidohydrolase n=1 Tax=Aquila chrysaetos chrysaetos TaxID=223781 RepID=A0A663EFL7_AQUCH
MLARRLRRLLQTRGRTMPASEAVLQPSPSKRQKGSVPGEPTARLRFTKLSENASTPSRGSAGAAGYDLYRDLWSSHAAAPILSGSNAAIGQKSGLTCWPELLLAPALTMCLPIGRNKSAYDCVIPPMEKAVVKTDIQIALPSGCYGRVAPRSGLAAKHFIDVGAGVIDEDYRGNVGVVLFNFGKETFEVKKGDRIAQLICERICYPELEEVQALDDTERGEGGFGSTGKN